jgi:hypothetical protein
LVEQLRAGIELGGRGERIVRMQLQPDGLGQVALRVELGADGLNIRLIVEHAATRELILASGTQLSQQLDQHSLTVAHLEVNLAGGQTSGGDFFQQARQQPPPQSGGRPALADDDVLAGVGSEPSSHRVDYRV